MILYFTGTGNSRYIAQRIAEALGDELFSMNDRIKAGDTLPATTDERLVIVTPTYAWRIPRIARDWLLKTDFPNAKQAWFVMTCGSEIGNAAQYIRALGHEKQLTYMGTAQIVMPENYIAMFSAPQQEEAQTIVSKAEPSILNAIEHIEKGQEFSMPRNNLYDRFMSGPINPIFYKFFVKADAFYAKKSCIGCGKCAKNCPVNNIELKNNLPVWGNKCTHCMAGICYCPAEAIEYGKKSVGKPRYHFEELQNGGNEYESTDN